MGKVIVDKAKETLEDCKINLESAIQEVDTYPNLIDFISVLKIDLQEIEQILISNFPCDNAERTEQISLLDENRNEKNQKIDIRIVVPRVKFKSMANLAKKKQNVRRRKRSKRKSQSN